jgi:hypothetical protein
MLQNAPTLGRGGSLAFARMAHTGVQRASPSNFLKKQNSVSFLKSNYVIFRVIVRLEFIFFFCKNYVMIQ